jgi:hypothetical protein
MRDAGRLHMTAFEQVEWIWTVLSCRAREQCRVQPLSDHCLGESHVCNHWDSPEVSAGPRGGAWPRGMASPGDLRELQNFADPLALYH